jgi:hypothetical protein
MCAVLSATHSTVWSCLSCIGLGIRGSPSTLGFMPMIGLQDLTRYFTVHYGGGLGILNETCQIFNLVQTFCKLQNCYGTWGTLNLQVGHLPSCSHGSDDSCSGSIHKFGTKLFDNLMALHKCKHLELFTVRADCLATNTEYCDRCTHAATQATNVARIKTEGTKGLLQGQVAG